MKINPVQIYTKNVNFQSQNDEERKRKVLKSSEKRYTTEDLNNYVVVASAFGAILAGTSVYLNYRPSAKNLKIAKQKVKDLTENNQILSKLNKKLKNEVQNAKNSLSDILEGDIAPKEQRENILNKLKEKIENGDYGYDIQTPPQSGKKSSPVFKDAIPLPEEVGTNNRIHIQKQNIPEIMSDGRFDYELPMSEEVKLTQLPSVDFKPVDKQLTNISESYADSVKWDNDKIARDILQNFYDGHGQTLDGVSFHFEPIDNNNYKVRIQGKSSFTPDKAIYIGESTKRNNARAAGNYGEGLKIATLKLLKDGGAKDIRIASDNWKITYTLSEGNLSDKHVLSYTLEKKDKYNGNYIEFETSDIDLLYSLRKTINRFYNSGNTHFKCPDFENELIGIKILPKGEKGGIYIAGQRLEVDNNYDGLKDIAIFLKEKPPVKYLDISRDRVSLNKSDFREIGFWLAKEKRMTKNDKVKFLKSLESYWGENFDFNFSHIDELIRGFVALLNVTTENLHIKFPEKYIAYSDATEGLVWDLKSKGYKICKSDFSELGMKTMKEFMDDARAHNVVIPNNVEKKKILIIKETLKKLSPALKDKHFLEEELDTKIFLFNRNFVKEKDLYSNVNAEAIVDTNVSKGFWLEQNYLRTAGFNDVLETALHELSHKAGGDESSEFSYKLTDVNKDAIGQIVNDVKTRNEMQALNLLWESLE